MITYVVVGVERFGAGIRHYTTSTITQDPSTPSHLDVNGRSWGLLM